MRSYSQTLSVDQCVKHFVAMVPKKGWSVYAEAEHLLSENLKQRSETETENELKKICSGLLWGLLTRYRRAAPFFSERGIRFMPTRVRYTVLLWEIPDL